MLIGMFGFYALWLPWYELRILPWRKLLRSAPAPGSPQANPREPIGTRWKPEHADILSGLKKDILAGPVLARPDYSRRFYLKTDWSSDGMGAVLLQADDNEDARQAEQSEDNGGACLFDITVSGQRLRLRPIAFLSRKCSTRERSYHS